METAIIVLLVYVLPTVLALTAQAILAHSQINSPECADWSESDRKLFYKKFFLALGWLSLIPIFNIVVMLSLINGLVIEAEARRNGEL